MSWNIGTYHTLSEYGLHFLGELLVRITRKIRNGVFVFGFVVAFLYSQQFHDSPFPAFLVLLGQCFTHEEDEITDTCLFPRSYFQLAAVGLQIHVGVKVRF